MGCHSRKTSTGKHQDPSSNPSSSCDHRPEALANSPLTVKGELSQSSFRVFFSSNSTSSNQKKPRSHKREGTKTFMQAQAKWLRLQPSRRTRENRSRRIKVKRALSSVRASSAFPGCMGPTEGSQRHSWTSDTRDGGKRKERRLTKCNLKAFGGRSFQDTKPNAHRGQALGEVITSEGSKPKPCNEDSRELEGPRPI